MTYTIINKSQVEIRLSNIDQAKEFLKKNPNCKSQILSDNQVVLIYPIDQTQRMTSLIKPASMTLNKYFIPLSHDQFLIFYPFKNPVVDPLSVYRSTSNRTFILVG